MLQGEKNQSLMMMIHQMKEQQIEVINQRSLKNQQSNNMFLLNLEIGISISKVYQNTPWSNHASILHRNTLERRMKFTDLQILKRKSTGLQVMDFKSILESQIRKSLKTVIMFQLILVNHQCCISSEIKTVRLIYLAILKLMFEIFEI